MNTLRFFYLLPMLFLILAACGNTEDSGGTVATSDASTANAMSDITIQPVDNEMKYKQTSITVKAGQEVTIVLENTATSPAMQHNVVVLTSNDDAIVNRVGQAAMSAQSNDYIPEDEAILAHTALAQPGQTVRVTFTTPSQPGTYRYICTFPGHYVTMQGTMTVE